MTEANKRNIFLKEVLYIHNLIWFKKDKVRALINSSSKVNNIASVFAVKLGFKVCFINVGAQKINGSTFQIFDIIFANFQIENKLEKTWFF